MYCTIYIFCLPKKCYSKIWGEKTGPKVKEWKTQLEVLSGFGIFMIIVNPALETKVKSKTFFMTEIVLNWFNRNLFDMLLLEKEWNVPKIVIQICCHVGSLQCVFFSKKWIYFYSDLMDQDNLWKAQDRITQLQIFYL